MGIEPTQSAWEAEVLPLNYTRIVVARFQAVPINIPVRPSGRTSLCGVHTLRLPTGQTVVLTH